MDGDSSATNSYEPEAQARVTSIQVAPRRMPSLARRARIFTAPCDHVDGRARRVFRAVVFREKYRGMHSLAPRAGMGRGRSQDPMSRQHQKRLERGLRRFTRRHDAFPRWRVGLVSFRLPRPWGRQSETGTSSGGVQREVSDLALTLHEGNGPSRSRHLLPLRFFDDLLGLRFSRDPAGLDRVFPRKGRRPSRTSIIK